MNKNKEDRENLFNPNLIFSGNCNEILINYPKRSKQLELYVNKEMNPKDLNSKFIKDGYMYLLRGAKNGQETGFYSSEYAKKNTIESLRLNPNNVAFAQYINGNTPFISATTDLYIASSFSHKERIYILKIPVEDVYTFYQCESLMEKEYMIPDFISSDDIVNSFRYNKFKQIYNYLTNVVGLNIIPEDLGVSISDINFPNEERIKEMINFNNGNIEFDPLLKIFQDFTLSVDTIKYKNEMSSRQIALFTDAHGLYEPVEAVLKDIKSRGITEIYSLGDNIGLGPNPKEVMNLFEEYGVVSLAGNYEEMINFGVIPYKSYLSKEKIENIEWTKNQLTEDQIKNINGFAHSVNLDLGGNLIGLCHFANDVRCDFEYHNSYEYLNTLNYNSPGYNQFYYTNSMEQLLELASFFEMDENLIVNAKTNLEALKIIKNHINKNLSKYQDNSLNGVLSYINDPLFLTDSKLLSVKDYNTIIQGHTHFSVFENDGKTSFHSIRAVGIGYDEKDKNQAQYTILCENQNGFEIETVNVPFDRDKMKHSILNCSSQNKMIKIYTKL